MRPSLLARSLPRTIRAILADAPSSPAATISPTSVHGWIKSARHHKNVSFFELSDGSAAEGLQVVLGRGRSAEGHQQSDAEAVAG